MVFAPLFLIGLRHMYNSVCRMIGLEVAAPVVHLFNVAMRGACPSVRLSVCHDHVKRNKYILQFFFTVG